MTKKRIVPAMALVTLALIIGAGCYKGTTLDLTQDIEITEEVSFAGDVIPLFEKSCSISGCHNSNGVSPDLSSDKAFNSLTNGGYVDLSNPENSLVYEFVSGKRTPVMPVSGVDPTIAATILAWLKQGAQNN